MKKLLSIQTGKARPVQIDGRRVMTAIYKTPALGDISLSAMGLYGDEQANLSVHGGLSKAVYAYPSEHYAFWLKISSDAGLMSIDDVLPFGSMGENLSLQGLLESDVWTGDVLKFPNCELRVTDPREPCFKFNAAMGFNGAAKAMAESGFCGFYLAMENKGTIRAGETFTLIPGARRQGIPESFNAKMFKHLR